MILNLMKFGFIWTYENRNFVPLPPFFLMRVSLEKTQSKNTVRVTSFQANTSNARGRSGRMEVPTTYRFNQNKPSGA